MKSIGGNSGYVGYSESVRSLNAKRDGKFPKTQFKKEYGISEKKFNELLDRGVIYNSEWHHTSKYGNKTQFYAIDDMILFCILTGDKEEAYRLYKKTRNYSTRITWARKDYYKQYRGTLILRPGVEADELIARGVPFNLTGRKNYSFSFDEKRLGNKTYRKYFNRSFRSENVIIG